MTQARIAITHANGLVAEALLQQLEESGFDPDSLVLLDREENSGNRLSFGDTHLTVKDQQAFDFEDLLAVVLSETDRELEDLLQHADCYILGENIKSNAAPLFILDPKNEQRELPGKGFVAIPDAALCSLLTVLQPLSSLATIERLNLVEIRSMASHGKPAIDELASQTINLLNSKDVECGVFPHQMAFNMLPEASSPTSEWFPCELLGVKNLQVSRQLITVAAFYGLCISVQVECQQPVDLEAFKQSLDSNGYVEFTDSPVTPSSHCQTGLKTIIYDLQQPENDANRLQFWIIADSVRNGLIQNYQNILHFLLNSFL